MWVGEIQMEIYPKTIGSLSILVVEDDLEVQALLKDEFLDEGYRVLQALDGEEAERIIEEEFFDVVIMDLGFPKGHGFHLLPIIKKRDKNIPVIIFSAFGDTKTRTEALRKGADRFVEKPFRMGALKNTVKEVVLKNKEV